MEAPRRKIHRNVVIVAFVALASGFGQDLITPILPGFLSALGVSYAGIGLIDGILQGTTSFFRFVSGFLSDRLRNRKSLIFVGYALSSVARPLLTVVGGFWPVAFLRGLDGAGKGMKDAPRDALVADSSARDVRGRAFGFHRLVDTAGSVFGPVLASILLLALGTSLMTYRFIFALALIPGSIALLLIWFGIREEPRLAPVQVTRRASFQLAFWLFTIGTAIAMATKINDSLFLVRAADAGVSSAWIPMLFGGFMLLYAVLSYPIGVLSDRVGKLPIIAGGWLVLSAVEMIFSFRPTLPVTVTLFALYGLFYALTEGSGRALIADLVPQESRGSAYAIFHTVMGLCVIAGGYGLGRAWDSVSPSFAFQIGATGSFVGFIVLSSARTYMRLPS